MKKEIVLSGVGGQGLFLLAKSWVLQLPFMKKT